MRIGALFLLISLLLAGCAALEQSRPPRFASGETLLQPPPEITPRHELAGHAVSGRPIHCFIIEDAQPQETIWFIAGIHGDEPAGTPLLEMFLHRLDKDPHPAAGRRVLILPALNPDGLAAASRHNVRGVDLNRNYPADNRTDSARHGHEALSEPESRALVALLRRYPPDRIITFHQPVGCVDYDGPALELAERFAAASGLPVRKLGARPGSMGAYFGETLGIPILTVELPGEVPMDGGALWQEYGRALVAMTH